MRHDQHRQRAEHDPSAERPVEQQSAASRAPSSLPRAATSNQHRAERRGAGVRTTSQAPAEPAELEPAEPCTAQRDEPSRAEPSQSSWSQLSHAQHSTAHRAEPSRADQPSAEPSAGRASAAGKEQRTTSSPAQRTEPIAKPSASSGESPTSADSEPSRAPISGSEKAEHERSQHSLALSLSLYVRGTESDLRPAAALLLADRRRSSMISLCWEWRGVENTGVGKREEGARGGRDQRLKATGVTRRRPNLVG